MNDEVSIHLDRLQLHGNLHIPSAATGLVLFVHGSGSSRLSPRNRYVAEVLQSRRLATLLFDLLTRDEEAIDERTRELRFNIPLLAERLIDAVHWVQKRPDTRDLPIGLFGASTGAAAALIAAAQVPGTVAALVSRGGRPDLAGNQLGRVRCPTLLLVGSRDDIVIQLNQQALAALACAQKRMVLIPGATHLFEEPGTLEQVAQHAAGWFERYLRTAEP